MKKIISLFLVLSMVLSISSVAFAAESLSLVENVMINRVQCKKFVSNSSGETVWRVKVPAYSQEITVRGDSVLLERYLKACKDYKQSFIDYGKTDVRKSVNAMVWNAQFRTVDNFLRKGEIFALCNTDIVLSEADVAAGKYGNVDPYSKAGIAIQDLSLKAGEVLISFEMIVQQHKDSSFVFTDSYN